MHYVSEIPVGIDSTVDTVADGLLQGRNLIKTKLGLESPTNKAVSAAIMGYLRSNDASLKQLEHKPQTEVGQAIVDIPQTTARHIHEATQELADENFRVTGSPAWAAGVGTFPTMLEIALGDKFMRAAGEARRAAKAGRFNAEADAFMRRARENAARHPEVDNTPRLTHQGEAASEASPEPPPVEPRAPEPDVADASPPRQSLADRVADKVARARGSRMSMEDMKGELGELWRGNDEHFAPKTETEAPPSTAVETKETFGPAQEAELSQRLRAQAEKAPSRSAALSQNASHIEAQKGRGAAERVLQNRGEEAAAMRSAMHEPVTLVYGKPGNPARHYKGGFGLSHIVAKHGRDVLDNVIDTVAHGKPFKKQTATGGDRVLLTHNGHTAVLSRFRHGNQESWLLTGWDEGNPGGNAPVYDATLPTPDRSTRSRSAGGAGSVDSVTPEKGSADNQAIATHELRAEAQEKNRLAMESMRKHPAATRASSIVKALGLNARNDGGDALSVVERGDIGETSPRLTRSGSDNGSATPRAQEDTAVSTESSLSPRREGVNNKEGGTTGVTLLFRTV